MKIKLLTLFVSFAALSQVADASLQPPKPAQGEYERSIDSVVRNKGFYKSGRIEVGPSIAVMPYDSIVNHYLIGGRATWHLSDHYGWEILDLQVAFPTVTGYTTDLVKSKGISNLQTTQLKLLVGSNFLVSPLYGKIRFFGSTVLYFDIYAILGLGLAKTDTLKFSSPATNSPATQSTLSSQFDPMFHFGFGFKIFINSALGLVIDMRDYVTYSTTYGKKSLSSNFAVAAGLTFFLPTF